MWTNIFIRLNICWFFPGRIYSDILSWSIYTHEYIRIFICPISMKANIFEYSLFPKKCKTWLLMVQNGSMLVKNLTKYGNGQTSPINHGKIFWYIKTTIFIHTNICWFCLWWIYSDIYSWSFYSDECIRIFICPIPMVENIFRYLFVHKLYSSRTVMCDNPFCGLMKPLGSLFVHLKEKSQDIFFSCFL